MTLLRCARHSLPAGWRCTVCEQVLCPECVATRSVNPVELTVCALCGELAEVLRVDRRLIQSFSSRALEGLLFPFHGLGLITFLGMTALLTFAWYGGGTLLLLASGFLLAGFFAVARSAGRGDGEQEAVGYSDLATSALLPGLRFAVVTFPTWGGLWLAQARHSAPLFWAAIALAFIWTPTAFLGAAAGTPLLLLLNPIAIIGTVVRIGADAARLGAFLLGLAVAGGLLFFAAAWANALPVPVLSTVLWAALTLYAPLTAAHLCGLMLLLHPEHFGWDNLSQQPALADAKPRGVAPPLAEARARPAHLQPIDLPDAPRPVSPPLEDAARPAYLEPIDPSDAPRPGAPPLEDAARPAHLQPLDLPDAPPLPVAVPRARLTELSAGALPSMRAHAKDLLRHAMKDADAALALDTFRSTPELAGDLSVGELIWVGRAAASEGADRIAETAFAAACAAPGDPLAVSGAHVYLAKLLDERLDRGGEAKGLLERVVRDFPGTPAAAFAAQWLARHP